LRKIRHTHDDNSDRKRNNDSGNDKPVAPLRIHDRGTLSSILDPF
jgi:hypothetical protein